MIVTRLFEIFIALMAASFVCVVFFLGMRIWWKIEDFLEDRSIEKAYPELKGKLK